VHAVPADFSPLWADPAFLRDIQYADDRNLAARQSIYVHQDPRQDLPSLVIDSLALAGGEAVVDVGCGNGLYLAGLASRGHRGPVAGIDMSPGMLAAARSRAPAANLIGGNAANCRCEPDRPMSPSPCTCCITCPSRRRPSRSCAGSPGRAASWWSG
jgi:SAM-dependent methyltransferase